MPNLRDRIKAKDDLPKIKVTVKEWDATFYLRELTAGERIELEFLLVNADDKIKRYTEVKCICFAAVDEKGDHIFEPADAEWMLGKNSKVVSRLFGKIFNGDIRAAEKN